MNSTTQHFQWIDRDTAARDLLQLAYHAPRYLSRQALELLGSIRSTAIIPELRKLVLGANNPYSYVAFGVIAATPGNILFSEFEAAAILEKFKIEAVLELLKFHPLNQEWILPLLYEAPFDRQLKWLWKGFFYNASLIAPHLTAFYDKQAHPLKLDEAFSLYGTGNENTRQWLQQRWDELIYLCLIYSADRKTKGRNLFPILDQWPELKADLFRRCPAMKAEVEGQKAEYEIKCAEGDVRLTPAWKRVELLYQEASTGDDDAIWAISREAPVHTYNEIPKSALAVHFLGKLIQQNNRAAEQCLWHLKYNLWVWVEPEFEVSVDIDLMSPVRYEAALAMSAMATAEVWEAMVEAYFMHPTHELKRILRRNITRITDQLSGVQPIEKGEEWDINRRPWFRVLTEPNPESQAMYAEYYGVEKTE